MFIKFPSTDLNHNKWMTAEWTNEKRNNKHESIMGYCEMVSKNVINSFIWYSFEMRATNWAYQSKQFDLNNPPIIIIIINDWLYDEIIICDNTSWLLANIIEIYRSVTFFVLFGYSFIYYDNLRTYTKWSR